MPDEEIIAEQEETEETLTDEGQAAFDEDEEVVEKKVEEEEKEEKEETKEEAKEETKPEEKEEKEEKPLTAKERLDKRVKDMEGEKEEAKEEEKPEEKETKEEKAETKAFSKEDIANRLSLISNEDLPGEMIIGDQTINLKNYAEEYPDEFATIKVVASAIAEKMVEKSIGSLEFAKPGEADEAILDLAGRVTRLSFDTAIAEARDESGELRYPTYFRDKKAIADWAGKQAKENPQYKKILGSFDPEDAMIALDLYYESTAKAVDKKNKDKAKSEKDKYDALHDDSPGGTKSIKKRPRSETMSREEVENQRDQEGRKAFDEEDE